MATLTTMARGELLYDLVIEGGGTKCVAFLGALQTLEERGLVIDRLLGTSAGAIIAALLACDYTSQEAEAALYDINRQQPSFTRLLGDPAPRGAADLRAGHVRKLLRIYNAPAIHDAVEEQIDTFLFDLLLRNQMLAPLLSFLEQGYWYSDKHFVEWLGSLLSTGSMGGKPRRFAELSLSEFYAETKRELSIIASDVTEARILILNHRTAPDCPLKWALRMSAGLPLVWAPVEWQDAWGMYDKRDITGHQIVDGEIFSPFPIELFISVLPQVTGLMGPKQTEHVLGFLIDETIPVPRAPAQEVDMLRATVKSLPPVRSLAQVLDALVRTRLKQTIRAVEKQIVYLPAKGYEMLDFQLSYARFDAIVGAARKATSQHFEQPADRAAQAENEQFLPLSAPSVVEFVNDSVRQQLAYIGVVNINTGGGAVVGGDVNAGGDFTGRDHSGG